MVYLSLPHTVRTNIFFLLCGKIIQISLKAKKKKNPGVKGVFFEFSQYFLEVEWNFGI